MPPRRGVAVRREEGLPRRVRPLRLRGAAAGRPSNRSQDYIDSYLYCDIDHTPCVTSPRYLVPSAEKAHRAPPSRVRFTLHHRLRGAARGAATSETIEAGGLDPRGLRSVPRSRSPTGSIVIPAEATRAVDSAARRAARRREDQARQVSRNLREQPGSPHRQPQCGLLTQSVEPLNT